MDIIWTCPLCGNEAMDENAGRCDECYRSMHESHITGNKCSECRKKLGLSKPDPQMYTDYPQLQLQLRTHEF